MRPISKFCERTKTGLAERVPPALLKSCLQSAVVLLELFQQSQCVADLVDSAELINHLFRVDQF